MGSFPVQPILVMNASEAELAPVLKANFMQSVIQITSNPLVVDTGREHILVDTGFGEKLGPFFGSFPGLEANLHRAGIFREHRSGRDIARSPGPHRRLGEKIGRAGVSRRLNSSLSIRSGTTGPATVTKARSTVRRCLTRSRRARLAQLERTCHRSQSPIAVREARRRNHKRRSLCCIRRDIRRPMPQSCSPPAMSSSSTWVTSRTIR